MKIQTGLSEQFFLVVHLGTKLTFQENSECRQQKRSINDDKDIFIPQSPSSLPSSKIWFNTTTIVPFEDDGFGGGR